MEIDIIDDLVTDDPGSALSARQGMILRQMIENTATASDIDALFGN